MIKEYGYEYNAVVNDKLLSETQWKSTDKTLWGARCLRSGRDALKAIARNYPHAKVFLPSICCDSMITPFEAYNCEIEFYPLTETLTGDDSQLRKLLGASAGTTILLFHDYFGIPIFSEAYPRELKSVHKNLILVRDITHNLLALKDHEKTADYTVASLRKWINIPDGGLLWTNQEEINLPFADHPAFAIQRLEAQRLRTLYFQTGDEAIKTKYRKIFSEVSAFLDEEKTPAKMTEYSYRIAASTDWEYVKTVRKENSAVLRQFFYNCKHVKVLDSAENESNLYVPILVNNRDRVQARLSSQGIFNTIIWPLRDNQIKLCKNAHLICSQMLAVPCDQRYTKEDMKFIAEETVRIIYEENNDSRR